MNFGEEIFKALTGRDHEPDDFRTMVSEVIEYRSQIGMSRREFSRQSGIPETTIRRWESEGGVNRRAQEARMPQLTRAYRSLISSPAAVARWRNNNLSVTLGGIPRTQREVSAAKLGLRAGTGAAAVEKFLNGDDKGAARTFVAGITDQFYRNVVFGRWIATHDEDLSDLAYEGDGYDDADGYFVTASAS